MLKNQWHLIELLYKIYKLHTLDLKFIDIISQEMSVTYPIIYKSLTILS